MEDVIQFIGKDRDWIAVKKLKLSDSNPEDVLFFLASLENTISRRIDHYVEKTFNVEGVLKILDEELKSKRASAKGVSEAISLAYSQKVRAAIKDIIRTDDKKKAKAIEELLKVYVMRKAFERMNVPADYGRAYEFLKPTIPRGTRKGAVV